MGKTKADEQAVKADAGKLRLTLVPHEVIRAIARVRMYGTEKYGDTENWRRVKVERYRDALLRHTLAYLEEPQGVDEESGLHHWEHMACNIAFIAEMETEKAREIQLVREGVPFEEAAQRVAKWAGVRSDGDVYCCRPVRRSKMDGGMGNV